MARGTALSTLRSMLRAEIGSTMQTSAATQSNTRHNQLLSNTQLWLTASYDWPFLRDEWDLQVAAGTQFLTLPTNNKRGVASTMNFDRPMIVDTLFNLFYFHCEWGIGYGDRNIRNFETTGVVQDPIQRVMPVTNANEATSGSVAANQIEVWPVPATTQKLRFIGQRVVHFPTMSSDSDTCDLDDLLVVFITASKILQEDQSPLAPNMAKMAQERLLQLRAASPSEERRLILGRNQLTTKKGKRILIAP